MTLASLGIALLAYILAAGNSVIDKYLLRTSFPHPVAYAFYVGIFSSFAIFVTPFDFEWLAPRDMLIALGAGIIFLFALIAFFSALKRDAASRVTSIVGGVTPLIILSFGAIFFDKVLSPQAVTGVFCLILGTILMSLSIETDDARLLSSEPLKAQMDIKNVLLALLASLFFGLFFVCIEYVFTQTNFLPGYFWMRVGSFVGAFLLLLVPVWRAVIWRTGTETHPRAGQLFVINKTIAGLAFFILNYAIFLGDAAIVNALEGAKYVFVFIFVYVLSKKFPHILAEQLHGPVLIQKVAGLAMITLGIFLVA